MPWTEAQQKLAGIALSMRQGQTAYSYSEAAAELARSMTIKQLKRMARGED